MADGAEDVEQQNIMPPTASDTPTDPITENTANNKKAKLPKEPKLPQQSEESIHIEVVAYIKKEHPYLIARTDFSSGARMSWGLIKKHNKVQFDRGFPDLFIAEPRKRKDGSGIYCGLFIEFKRDNIKIFKKDGVTFSNEHFEEQFNTLTALMDKGYYAVFAFGYDMAIRIIEGYLSNNR